MKRQKPWILPHVSHAGHLQGRSCHFKVTAIVAALLITIGVISTFPPFFMLFAYE